MLPAQSPGAFVIQQSIIYLNLRTFYPLRRSADQQERSSHLQNYCGRNKTRTCDLTCGTMRATNCSILPNYAPRTRLWREYTIYNAYNNYKSTTYTTSTTYTPTKYLYYPPVNIIKTPIKRYPKGNITIKTHFFFKQKRKSILDISKQYRHNSKSI